MNPQQHTDLINKVLANQHARLTVGIDLLEAIANLRKILTSFPRPALEQLIAALRVDKPDAASLGALAHVESKLDALYAIL